MRAIVDSRYAPWIGRMIGLAVSAQYSVSGRVCLPVDLWNSPKLNASRFS